MDKAYDYSSVGCLADLSAGSFKGLIGVGHFPCLNFGSPPPVSIDSMPLVPHVLACKGTQAWAEHFRLRARTQGEPANRRGGAKFAYPFG